MNRSNEQGIFGFIAKKAQNTTKEEAKARLNFEKKYNNKPYEFWEKVH